MNEILTINNYPIGWSWLKSVPLEDFTWLIEVFSTMTDNIDTYNYCQYNNRKLIHVDTKGLAHFLCNDQGYEAGIKEYFEIVHIETQELTSIGFKTAILDL